jgi:hypothetical protein
MRRVTVRVEDGDWHFRAERTDGRVLFELEYAEDGTQSAPPMPAAVGPGPAPTPAPSLAALVNDEEYERSLDEVIKALGKNMPPGPPLTRVVEIGGFVGAMTKRLHRMTEGDRAEPVYMVDPFLGRSAEEANAGQQMLALNVASISPRTIPGSAREAADQMSPMNVDLLCISAHLGATSLSSLVSDWMRHLSAAGIIIGRFHRGSARAEAAVKELDDLFMEYSLEVTPLTDQWFMATRAEAKA